MIVASKNFLGERYSSLLEGRPFSVVALPIYIPPTLYKVSFSYTHPPILMFCFLIVAILVV